MNFDFVIRASNASVIQMRKVLISPQVEMRAFCLLRRYPNPPEHSIVFWKRWKTPAATRLCKSLMGG